jgi:hypothetical protein
MGSMLGGAAKGGFTGGTEKDKQMNSLMMFFTNSMNEMFGSMAPKPAATQPACAASVASAASFEPWAVHLSRPLLSVHHQLHLGNADVPHCQRGDHRCHVCQPWAC